MTASACTGGLASATRLLVVALSLLYLTAALAGILWIDFDTTRDLVLWLAFLCSGAVRMLAGELAARSPGWRSATLVSIGAAAAAFPSSGRSSSPSRSRP